MNLFLPVNRILSQLMKKTSSKKGLLAQQKPVLPALGLPAAQQAAAEQQQLLRAMIEGMETGVMVFDDQKVIYANPEFVRMLGYEAGKSLEGMPINGLIADSDQQAAAERRKAVSGGQRIPSAWVQLKAKGGGLVETTLSMDRVFWNGQAHFITALTRRSGQEGQDMQQRKTASRYERFLVAELEKQQSDMARELHDGLGSELAVAVLMLGSIKALRPGDTELAEKIDQAMGQVKVAVEMTRGLARGLMPVDAHAGGFLRAMDALACDWSDVQGLQCEFEVQGSFESVSAETGTHVYRIAQEAMTNAVRHGRASRVRLTLSQQHTDESHDMVLEIKDNGSGFDTTGAHAVQQGGVGIRSMIARARTIGGHVEFLPGRPTGSCIRVVWPGRRDDSGI